MRFKILFSLVILGSLLLAFAYKKVPRQYKEKVRQIVPKIIQENTAKETSYIKDVPSYITNDSIHYAQQKNRLAAERKTLYNEYKNANTSQARERILEKSATVLYSHLVDSLIPYWYGTPWDFNGISQKPGQGNIACGYFVFTLLRDAGIKLPRVKMSQAASEQAIKSLVNSKDIKRYSNIPLADFVQKTKALGSGVYLVGLDNHVGLYQVATDSAWFLHSSVIYPSCVVKEIASQSPALDYSSYRVVGKLSSNKTLTKKWLLQEYVSLQ